MKITQTVMEFCKNCYDRFWSFDDLPIHCIACGDLDGYTIEVNDDE